MVFTHHSYRCFFPCLCSALTRKQTRTNARQLHICTVLTLHYFKRLTHRVSYYTILDKDPKCLTRTPPFPLSEEYLQHNFDYPKFPGDKWKQRRSSQRSSENNGSGERRGSKLHKEELLAQLSPKISLFLNGAFLSKISFSKQALQMIVKNIWQSLDLLFVLVLDSPETDSCSYCSNLLTSGTAVTMLLIRVSMVNERPDSFQICVSQSIVWKTSLEKVPNQRKTTNRYITSLSIRAEHPRRRNLFGELRVLYTESISFYLYYCSTS